MEYPSNPTNPDLYDVFATAVYLAAVELAEVYPQPDTDDSVDRWKKYLLQQALKKQEQMTEEQRFAFRQTHFPFATVELTPIEKSCWQCKYCEERFKPGKEPMVDYSDCTHPAHEEEHRDRGESMAEDCPDYQFDESLRSDANG